MNIGDSVTFNYTGNVQTFNVDNSGYYLLECWGGQGGNITSAWGTSATGGQGGYTKTYAKLRKGDKLFVAVGGRGADAIGQNSGNVAGGYNGGAHGGFSYDHDAGNFNNTGGGGGATHIALNSNRGTLNNYASYQSEILGVAGGGGGATWRNQSGADNGGTGGGTVNCGGSGLFGLGAPTSGVGAYPAGGGGGWEGGRSGNWVGTYYRTSYGGTGHYKNASMVIGGTTYTSVTQNGGKTGTGQAKVTFMKRVSVYVGDNDADVYVGDNPIDAIYVGDNEA